MAKPAFDPSKPFEAASEKKPAFDPGKSYDVLEVDRLDISEEPSLLSKIGSGALDAVVTAGKFVDSYTGAPTRAAIGAYQDGGSPLSAFAGQFGENPDLAPTGKQIASRSGLSTEETISPFGPLTNFKVSPAGVAGFGIDVAADPTNLLPLAAAAKGAGKGLLTTVKGAGRGANALVRSSQPAAKALDVIAETSKATKAALDNVFRPKQADDFAQWVSVAEKNGIDPSILPESIEFGPGSVISRGARTVREGPIGDIDMKRFEDGLLQVDGAVDNKIFELSGGAPIDPVEAGNVIRAGYDEAVESLFDNVDFTYNGVIQQSPGIRLTPQATEALNSKLSGVEKFAKGRVLRGITKTDKEQGNQILAAVANIRQGNGSLKQVHEAMADLGRYAFKKTKGNAADVPVDQKKFQDLYFSLREAFINSTADQLGPDVANALIDSNAQIDMFLKNKAPIANLLDNKQLAPEKLFKSLIVGGDTTKLKALKEMLTPEQFKALRGSYVRELAGDSNEVVNFGRLRTALSKNRTTLSVLFEPQEITDLVELVQLGEKWGPAVLSTSGTGGTNLFRDMLEGIKSGATNRTTLDLMKDSARGRSVAPPPKDPTKFLPPGKSGFQRPTRSGPEEAAKLAQMLAVIDQNKKNEEQSATQRRLEEIIRKRAEQ